MLRSPVLGFFLDQLKGTKVAASITPAVEDVRGGKFEEAASILDKSGDDQLAAAFLKGLVLLSKGELDPAANKFRDALRIDSEFYPATFYLGACYAAGGATAKPPEPGRPRWSPNGACPSSTRCWEMRCSAFTTPIWLSRS